MIAKNIKEAQAIQKRVAAAVLTDQTPVVSANAAMLDVYGNYKFWTLANGEIMDIKLPWETTSEEELLEAAKAFVARFM